MASSCLNDAQRGNCVLMLADNLFSKQIDFHAKKFFLIILVF